MEAAAIAIPKAASQKKKMISMDKSSDVPWNGDLFRV